MRLASLVEMREFIVVRLSFIHRIRSMKVMSGVYRQNFFVTSSGDKFLIWKRGLLSLGLAWLIGVVPASICEDAVAQNLPVLGDTAREELSPLMERRLGEQIMYIVRRDPDYIDDWAVSEYLNRLGNKMLEARPDARGEANFNFDFFAVRDPVLNAFAFPGGFIGFHSGLILSAQSESELASVMGHEIGHVAQRHIARMLAAQKYDAFIPIAALALAILAARSSPDAAIAVASGGQGLAIQKQLNFSRDAEREADRIGFLILRDAGFDTNGMVSFFGRLQSSMRNYSDNAPAFLRSHPLTSERIADIQGRVADQRYKQVPDGLDFLLAKARIKVLQDPGTQGLIDARAWFEQVKRTGRIEDLVMANYGLAFVAMKQGRYSEALQYHKTSLDIVQGNDLLSLQARASCMFACLELEIKFASKSYEDVIQRAERAMTELPLSRGIAYIYAEALMGKGAAGRAESFLRDQISLYRTEPKLHKLLAKTYAQLGKQSLQHIALADEAAVQGAWSAAIHQLEIARQQKDAGYYDMSVIDAKEREWKEVHKEELAAEKKQSKQLSQ